jgi:hypothetical protein
MPLRHAWQPPAAADSVTSCYTQQQHTHRLLVAGASVLQQWQHRGDRQHSAPQQPQQRRRKRLQQHRRRQSDHFRAQNHTMCQGHTRCQADAPKSGHWCSAYTLAFPANHYSRCVEAQQSGTSKRSMSLRSGQCTKVLRRAQAVYQVDGSLLHRKFLSTREQAQHL